MTTYVYKSTTGHPVNIDNFTITPNPGLQLKYPNDILDTYLGTSINRYDDGVLVSSDPEVPVMARKTLAGGLRISAAGKEVTALGILANQVLGAKKWFGGVQDTDSFNETGVFSIANYGAGLKIEAEAPFSAVRIVWVNRAANAMTGSKALVGATEQADYSVAGTAFHPVVNGATYNALATTTQPYGYKPVTWGGAATVDHPAANLAAQVKVSDRIPCSSVPRADGGVRPLLIMRGEHDGVGGGSFATYSNAGISAIRTASTAARGRILQLFTGTSMVTTPTVNGSIATGCFEFFPIFEYDVPSLTVFSVGDSITQAEGLSLTGIVTNWGWRGCADASTPQRPINYVNAGCSGKQFTEYWLRTQELVTAGVVPDVLVVQPLSINDYSGNVNELAHRIELGKARAKEVMAYAKANGIRSVCFVGLLPWNSLALSNDNLRKGYNAWLAATASAMGCGYLDFSALGDGASPERWVPAYNNAADGIHENELAIDTVMASALTAYLNTI